MSPRAIATTVRREAPLLHEDDTIGASVGRIVEADLPALPVVDRSERLTGIFGEREFIGALFPAYLGQLGYAAFVPRSLEAELEKRAGCAVETVAQHMNTEHVDVDEEHSDFQLAEIFLHHRVLIVPIVDSGRVTGVITREEFFRALATRFDELT